MFKFFRKNTVDNIELSEQSLTTDPTKGEHWRLKPTKDDPFPPVAYDPVEILDVKNGWIRYKMGRIFPDLRMELEIFLHIYERA